MFLEYLESTFVLQVFS